MKINTADYICKKFPALKNRFSQEGLAEIWRYCTDHGFVFNAVFKTIDDFWFFREFKSAEECLGYLCFTVSRMSKAFAAFFPSGICTRDCLWFLASLLSDGKIFWGGEFGWTSFLARNWEKYWIGSSTELEEDLEDAFPEYGDSFEEKMQYFVRSLTWFNIRSTIVEPPNTLEANGRSSFENVIIKFFNKCNISDFASDYIKYIDVSGVSFNRKVFEHLHQRDTVHTRIIDTIHILKCDDHKSGQHVFVLFDSFVPKSRVAIVNSYFDSTYETERA